MAFEGKVITIAAILVVLNYLSGGYIFEEAQVAMEGEQGEYLTDNAKCLVGLMILPPLHVINILGYQVTVFLPSWDDVLLAFFMGVFAIWIMQTLFHWKMTLFKKFIIIFMIWFALKLFALWLIIDSPGCLELVAQEHDLFQPVHLIGMLLMPLVLLKFLARKMM